MKTSAEHSTTTHSRSAAQSESAGPFFGHTTGWDNDATSTAEPFFTPASVQPKLKVGAPNDKYEQEADSVADQVVQRLAQPATEAVASPTESGKTTDVQAKTKAAPSPILPTISRIQRSVEPELQEKNEGELEGEEPGVQRKPIFESDGDVQRQSIFESEHVQRQPTGAVGVQRQCSDCETKEEGMVRRMPFAGVGFSGVQRKCAACEAEEKVQPKRVPALQRSGDGGFTASDDFSSRLQRSKGGGQPMDSGTRSNMEGAIGADFSGVRVHTGSQAAGLSDEIGAKAFTHGNDIYFNSGQYNPSSPSGQHLLAHELAHTVQQGGSVRRKVDTPKISVKNNEQKSVQRSIIDDIAGYLLTGNSVLDFLVGVGAGIIEWVGDLIMGVVNLFREASRGNIGAFIAIIGIVIVVILAILFPEVVIPILLGLGIVAGLISMAYFIYMMTRPGLTPYERGKYLGKAIIEAVLIGVAGAELIKFVKTYAEVAKLASALSLLQRLRLVKKLMRAGELPKVLQFLAEVGDVEKTVQILEVVNDIDKASELVRLAGNIDDLIRLINTEGVAIDALLDLLRIGGISATDVLEFLRFPQMTLSDILEFMRFPGMNALEFRSLLARPGISVVEIRNLLGRNGMTIDVLKELLDAIPDIQALKRLLDVATSPNELLRTLQAFGNDFVQLERYLLNFNFTQIQQILAASRAAAVPIPPNTLIRLMNLALRVGFNDESRIVRFIQNASQVIPNQHTWTEVVEWTRLFFRRNRNPLPFASGSKTDIIEYAQMTRPDGSSVWVKVAQYDMNHVLKGHSWRYFSWDPRNFAPNRPFTTLFGSDVGVTQIQDVFRSALRNPNLIAEVGNNPAQWVARDYNILNYLMRIGINFRNANPEDFGRMTQAYPKQPINDLVKIARQAMLGIKEFLGK